MALHAVDVITVLMQGKSHTRAPVRMSINVTPRPFSTKCGGIPRFRLNVHCFQMEISKTQEGSQLDWRHDCSVSADGSTLSGRPARETLSRAVFTAKCCDPNAVCWWRWAAVSSQGGIWGHQHWAPPSSLPPSLPHLPLSLCCPVPGCCSALARDSLFLAVRGHDLELEWQLGADQHSNVCSIQTIHFSPSQ